jgi:hypothetical protein
MLNTVMSSYVTMYVLIKCPEDDLEGIIGQTWMLRDEEIFVYGAWGRVMVKALRW